VQLRNVGPDRREHWRCDPGGALRAISSDGRREYWLRRTGRGRVWRLLVFDDDGYLGAVSRADLRAAKRAAQQWEQAPGLFLA
jgi:hypothetical protein